MNFTSIKNKSIETIASCAFGIVKHGTDIQIFPAGVFDAPRGSMRGKGPWRIDVNIATALINRVSGRVNDILIDYEHQSILSEKNGKEVPAAGWLGTTTLYWRDGEGIYARNPRWTDKAKRHIAQDEYKYLSPVFSYDKNTGAVLDLISIALTNTPALDGMDEVQYQAAAKQLLEYTADNKNLSDTELAVCSAMGIEPAEFQKKRDAMYNNVDTKSYPGLTTLEVTICDNMGLSRQDFAAMKEKRR